MRAANRDGVGLLIFVFGNQIMSVAAKLLRAFGCGTPQTEGGLARGWRITLATVLFAGW